MKQLYKSFEELFNEFPSIAHFIQHHEIFLAHTPKQRGQVSEKLIEHIEKVNQYALTIINVHSLNEIANNLIDDLIVGQSKFVNTVKIGNYIKSLFVRSIIFHDYGKINPNFQVRKMSNDLFKWDNNINIDSQHSKLSAFIFIHFHLKEITESFEEEAEGQSFLWALTFLFSNPILKHHASYIEHDIRFDEHIYNSLVPFLNVFGSESEDAWLFFLGLEKRKDGEGLLDFFEKYCASENSFAVFALLKLNFSLLTASDYYATGEYMQNIKVNDFGLIEGELRKKIIKNFKTTKDYNQSLFNDTQSFLDQPFEALQKSNKENLNLLRQKLAAEALTNLRKYNESNLFYLEAPTGSGKTNVSLALAIELLNQGTDLNKVFYVFPFTTLITQTFDSIKDVLKIDNEHIIQLHSKSGFHQKDEAINDGNYGVNRLNFLNNHFVNYPITLLSHIKFFDILKGNGKDTNYIFHRLANSVVVIDELQAYNPKHWDKTIYFLSKYASLFNMKIILMSATLPKIGNLLTDKSRADNITNLISKGNKSKYFQNPNFAGRVTFDFSILDKWNWERPREEDSRLRYLSELADKLFEESEKYAVKNILKKNSVRTLIEFITKKSASRFQKLLQQDDKFSNYKVYLISGEILDTRRRQIINAIKAEIDDEVILITTQVVEAGVDIDMDLGFKDRSLIDSDEQLAGRVNRNANKEDCKVFMFDFDKEAFIYRGDKRLEIDVAGKGEKEKYKSILSSKDFDTDYYDQVQNEITRVNRNEAIQNLSDYLQEFDKFNFKGVNEGFKLIEQENESIFIPLYIPKAHFSIEDQKVMDYFKITDSLNNGTSYISGHSCPKRFVALG